ncbi:neprilysin-11-like [Ornithodoros turicata]|uniref:neprilysin-11-like n=1 Tax=Ornithodoros turicata TaxID=34597 RepID=UPI003138E76A
MMHAQSTKPAADKADKAEAHDDISQLRSVQSESSEECFRRQWEQTEEFTTPLGEAPPFEYSEGKWLKSGALTVEASAPESEAAAHDGMRPGRKTLAPAVFSCMSSPSAEMDTYVSSDEESISDYTDDTFVKTPQGFVPKALDQVRPEQEKCDVCEAVEEISSFPPNDTSIPLGTHTGAVECDTTVVWEETENLPSGKNQPPKKSVLVDHEDSSLVAANVDTTSGLIFPTGRRPTIKVFDDTSDIEDNSSSPPTNENLPRVEEPDKESVPTFHEDKSPITINVDSDKENRSIIKVPDDTIYNDEKGGGSLPRSKSVLSIKIPQLESVLMSHEDISHAVSNADSTKENIIPARRSTMAFGITASFRGQDDGLPQSKVPSTESLPLKPEDNALVMVPSTGFQHSVLPVEGSGTTTMPGLVALRQKGLDILPSESGTFHAKPQPGTGLNKKRKEPDNENMKAENKTVLLNSEAGVPVVAPSTGFHYKVGRVEQPLAVKPDRQTVEEPKKSETWMEPKQTWKDPNSAYVNCGEGERHSIVSRKLRTIPMRLFMANLFAAFFLVVLMHHGLLASIKEQRNRTIPTEGIQERPICRTLPCRAAGTNLFYALNLTARPCDSIYDVVCKPWVHSNPAQYRRTALGSDLLVLENINTDARRALLSHHQSSSKTGLDKLQRLYLLCIDEEERDRRGLADFWKRMRRYGLEGWPQRADGVLGGVALFVRDTGSDVFFRLTSTSDGNDVDVMTVECPELGLPAKSFTEGTKDVDLYRAYIVSMLSVVTSASVQNITTEIVTFETLLARLILAHCHESPYEDEIVEHTTSLFDMARFISTAVPHYKQGRRMIFQSWDFFVNVVKVMSEKRVAATLYFGWRVALRLLPFTTTSIATLHQQFQATMGSEFSTTWKQCLKETNEVMPFAMARLLLSENTKKAASYRGYRLLSRLVRSLDRQVYKDRWFDGETHTTYTSLRAKMTTMFGYPPTLMNDAHLDAAYEPVEVSNSYLEAHLSASTVTFRNNFDANFTFRFYGRERYIFPSDVLSGRRSVRPLYDVRRNSFIVPSGMLRPPYYDDDATSALNFGGLGFLVAYDVLQGLLSNRSDTYWGRLVAKTSIPSRRACLESRIARYASKLPRKDLDLLVLAARVAFEASQDDADDDETLGGLEDFSPEQLFFVAVARTLCTVARNAHFAKIVLQGGIVGELQQVDAALMWLPEFRDSFNCTHSRSPHHVGLSTDGC